MTGASFTAGDEVVRRWCRGKFFGPQYVLEDTTGRLLARTKLGFLSNLYSITTESHEYRCRRHFVRGGVTIGVVDAAPNTPVATAVPKRVITVGDDHELTYVFTGKKKLETSMVVFDLVRAVTIRVCVVVGLVPCLLWCCCM
jgi:hypothetical protein